MKILVSAASRHGATAEIADAIATAIRETGVDVDAIPPEDVTDVADYDAFVLGSGIYAGRWLEPARRLVERHHAVFVSRSVWLFSSGPIGEPLQPTEEPHDGADLSRQLSAVEHRVFAGKLNREDLGWVERTITGMLKAPDGDFRDWEDIGAWGREIAATLEPASAPAGTTA